MVRAKRGIPKWGMGVLALGLVLFGLNVHVPKASAGVYRFARNTVEQERRAECGVQPYTIYGITWINDTARSSGGMDRWDESISVAYNATTIDATLWTDAYNCKESDGGQPRYNAEIYNLKSASGGQVPISFPNGTRIFRGDSLPGQFTDPPGSLRVRLNIGTRGDGCYSVAYSGRYRDSRGAGAANTSYSTVCITREEKPDSGEEYSSTSCPAVPRVDITHVTATFPEGEPSESRPWNPKEGDTYIERAVTGRHITGAYDTNTGDSVSYTDTTVSFVDPVANAPYDSNSVTTSYVNDYDAITWKYVKGVWIKSKVSSYSLPTYNPPSATHKGYATLDACYYRTFVIEPQGGDTSVEPPSSDASFNDLENPKSASISDTVKVTFGFDGPEPSEVRTKSCVRGISTTVDAVVRHADDAPDGSYPYGMTSSSFPGTYCGTTDYPTSTGYGYPSASYGASIPSLRYGDQICFQLTATPGSGEMKQDGTIVSSDGFASDPEQTCSRHLAARPYLRIFGGDVLVGGGVQQTNPAGTISTCPAISNATINAWNRGPSGSYAGSGGQYAVQALGLITSFSSNLANPSANPAASGPRPRGLTFANTTGTYGGSYGAVPGCKDYAENLLPPPATQKYFTDKIIGSTHLGVDTAGVGQHVTYYVKGNVYITGNITYDNSASWTSPKQIPTFKLIVVGGNIYISPSVTRLDGMYVAEKDTSGSGGTVYTCADSSGTSAMSQDQLFDGCANALTINGSLVANKVDLLRTRGQNGSNWQSSVSETPYDSRAAEIFNYTPEQWIAQPPSRQNVEYDSITSLAPVL